MSRLVIDSYAILAIWRQEEGARKAFDLLVDPDHERWMSVINVGEVFYKVAREEGPGRATNVMAWVDMLSVQFVDANRAAVAAASLIKSSYPLSYADCFAVALAQRHGAAVVTGDPEFAQMEDEGIIAIEWLPRKPKRSRR